MVYISKLPLITSPEQFFSVERVLMLDFLNVPAKTFIAEQIKEKHACILSDGLLWFPVFQSGKPHSFFTNAVKGVPYKITNEIEAIVRFDGNISEAIRQKKCYDYSEPHSWAKGILNPITPEPEFLVDRYFTETLKPQLF